MTDLARSFSEAKSLPDNILKEEMERPSGLMPTWLAASELSERQAIRGSAYKKKPTITQQIMARANSLTPMGDRARSAMEDYGIPSYAGGGIIKKLNPFIAMTEAMQDPQVAQDQMSEDIMALHGNRAPLMAPLKPNGPSMTRHTTDLQPVPPGTPSQPPAVGLGLFKQPHT